MITRRFFPQVAREEGNEVRAVKEARMGRGAFPQGRTLGTLRATPAARKRKEPCALWHRRSGRPRAVRFVAPRPGGSDRRASGATFRRATRAACALPRRCLRLPHSPLAAARRLHPGTCESPSWFLKCPDPKQEVSARRPAG